MNLKRSIQKRLCEIRNALGRLLAPHKYSHIVSLGFNCEVAFQFLQHHGNVESHLFNWYYSDSTKELIRSLRSLETVGLDFKPSCYMWRDVSYGLAFHGRGNHDIWDADTAQELLQADKEELISRIAHLKKKFMSLANKSDSILFVYKPWTAELSAMEDCVQNIIELQKALKDIGMKAFHLLIVIPQEHEASMKNALKIANSTGIFVESVTHYAPNNNVTGGDCDKKGWQRIWQTYIPKHRLKKTKKKYKFDS